jgi:hypothetical protein
MTSYQWLNSKLAARHDNVEAHMFSRVCETVRPFGGILAQKVIPPVEDRQAA